MSVPGTFLSRDKDRSQVRVLPRYATWRTSPRCQVNGTIFTRPTLRSSSKTAKSDLMKRFD